jgi:3-oxoacyl-[acyl-carrier-protein] synthase III
MIPHQANARILEHVAKKLKVSPDKFYSNVEWAGNTSAASIPIAICDAADAGRLRPDDNVIFVGFGGGLTWASAAVKWDVTPPEVSTLDREWKRTRYIVARGRSRWRKVRRRIEAKISGSPTPDARMRDADKPE